MERALTSEAKYLLTFVMLQLEREMRLSFKQIKKKQSKEKKSY
jgi:hypothetical protein